MEISQRNSISHVVSLYGLCISDLGGTGCVIEHADELK